MIVLLDNYDSFTYNIFQSLSKLGFEVEVIRSDSISLEQIEQKNPTHLILGPGPKTPQEAGICIQAVQHFKGKIPILGICLGHQAILSAFGVPIINAKNIVHGKVEPLKHIQKGLFRHISKDTPITRYHSLVGDRELIPDCFYITALSEDGEVMAVEHKEFPLFGVQFHPESIGTQEGEQIFKNFLNYKYEHTPIQVFLKKALALEHLSFKESMEVMDEITEGYCNDAQIASLFTSLEIKGVSAEELAGFASVLRKKAADFPPPQKNEKRLDIVGTGGSANKTFNVSTTASLLLGSAGVNVVKHGNRAITSKSGSADLLEALGVNVNMDIATSILCYKKLHFTFLFAIKYHSALRFASNARKSLGFRTAFNLIGPLSNPGSVTHQLIGVFDPKYTLRMTEALNMLGVKHALVVSGFNQYDEFSLSAPTRVCELRNGSISTYDFTPNEIGLDYVDTALLRGGESKENLQITLDIFNNKPSPKLDLVCLNVGAALYLYEECSSIKEGFMRAKEIVKNGGVWDLLEKFKALSHS